MKKFAKLFAILLNILLLTQSMGVAMENKIKFDKEFHRKDIAWRALKR